MKTLFIDIMTGGGDKYIFTLRYRYCPAFKIDIADIYNKVLEARPSLKNKKIDLYF